MLLFYVLLDNDIHVSECLRVRQITATPSVFQFYPLLDTDTDVLECNNTDVTVTGWGQVWLRPKSKTKVLDQTLV